MKEKLHILFLCGWYPSKVLPTNGDFIERHAEAVSILHKVSVLHIISDKNLIEKTQLEKKTINGIDTYIGYIKHTQNPIFKFIRFWKIYTSILKTIGNFDVVHLNILYPFGLFALHLKWFKKKPFIISEHWTRYIKPNSNKIGFVERNLSKIICKRSSFICPVSNHLSRSMIDIGLNGNFTVVPNVVDTTIFVPKKNHKSTFNIIHISSMQNKHKNIFGMLEVAKKLENEIENFNWKFIGGNSTEIKNKIDSLNFKKQSVEFIKHLPHQKLITYLQDANVFVLFSNYENLPCVILEAFSCGIPVISTNVGGISEFFPKEFGNLIEVNNQNQLLEKLKEYKINFNFNKKIMHNYAVDNFSKEKIALIFSNLYLKSLTNNK